MPQHPARPPVRCTLSCRALSAPPQQLAAVLAWRPPSGKIYASPGWPARLPSRTPPPCLRCCRPAHPSYPYPLSLCPACLPPLAPALPLCFPAGEGKGGRQERGAAAPPARLLSAPPHPLFHCGRQDGGAAHRRHPPRLLARPCHVLPPRCTTLLSVNASGAAHVCARSVVVCTGSDPPFDSFPCGSSGVLHPPLPPSYLRALTFRLPPCIDGV